jgi:hypothetical protein
VVDNGVILRLLTAGREVRTMVVSPARAAETRAILDTGDVQPGTRVSFIASDPDDEEGRLDAIAGSEFVDDRIRLLE